jgi:5-formyltetrahydrofolate cyclo-ligase
MKERLGGLEARVFLEEGAAGAELLGSLPVWGLCRSILLFLSMPDEISTMPALEAALRRGKRVFAPRTVVETGRGGASLAFFRVYGSGVWREGAFGIREPASARLEDRLDGRDFPALILTPGAAFDCEGRRLGRGLGCYDRFFSGLDRAKQAYTAVGFCVEAQIIERAPAEPHDKPMDLLCTGARLIVPARTGARGGRE